MDQVRVRAQQLERIREELLELASGDPDKFGAVIRPAALCDKSARLLREFIDPPTRRPLWWQEENR